MNARIHLTWTRSISPNLSKQTLEVVADGNSWGEQDVGLNEVTDVLSPENANLLLILRSYNQEGKTGEAATTRAEFKVPVYSANPTPQPGPTSPPPASEPLTLPATNFQAVLSNWE